jgi:hypothetical protein
LRTTNTVSITQDLALLILNETIRNHFPTKDASCDAFQFKGFLADFLSIRLIITNYPKWAAGLKFDLVFFAKHLFFDSISKVKNHGAIRYKFESIIKSIEYLAANDQYFFEEQELSKYYQFLIMHGISKNKVVKRANALSYQNFSYNLEASNWLYLQHEYGYPVFGYSKRLSKSKKNKAIKSAVFLVFGDSLTLEEWKTGGCFNFLTLDYGQFYVSHCIDFFESNLIIAAAIKKTLNEALDIAINAGLKLSIDSLKSYGITTICQFLLGSSVKDLSYSMKKKTSVWNQKVLDFTIQRFQENYFLFNQLSLAHDQGNIQKIILSCDRDPGDPKTFQLFQNLITKIILRGLFSSEDRQYQLLNEDLELHKLDLMGLSNLEHLVEISLKNFERKPIRLSKEYFENLGVPHKSTQATYIHSFLRMVEDAGITNFVALTGWRESEYGFSLEDIEIKLNNDWIDSAASGCTYEIRGLIPKTHGNAFSSREVTTKLFILLLKQSLINIPAPNYPCLYTFLSSAKAPSISSEFIQSAIGKLWTNYVNFYKPFAEIAEAKRSEEFLENDFDPLVLAARDRAHEEILRVEFFLKNDQRRKLIWRYKHREFPIDILQMIDGSLSDETKELCDSFENQEQILPWHSEYVMAEILGDCLYPTPHALRHMWAEGVLRRFDGDVGWAIRSHFQHFSSTMWKRYVTNKDSQRIYNSAKHSFLNSVLNNYAVKRGQGYAGPTQKLLRRLVTDSKTIPIDDLSTIVNQFGKNFVASIKSNPWGFCILRTKHQAYAKCAEHGEPNRQNASPGACLGCRFNLLQSGNIDGILISIENDLNVLKHQNVPQIFLEQSIKTVKLAYKALIGLNANQEIVSEINKTLSLHKS